MSTWGRYSTSHRHSFRSRRDEVVSVQLGRGVCRYGDGPLHRIEIIRADLPEDEFIAAVETIIAALNAPKIATDDHAAAEADAIERRADRFAREA